MICTGLEIFLAKSHKDYRKLRLGVLCNQASVDQKLRHASDLLLQKKLGLNLACFIGPQHGIRGEKQDNMVESDDFVDPRHGLPVFSLYGVTREPSESLLSKVDAFVVDLQDIGTRIYTFMYTLANCMRAAKRTGKKVIVLDRPNPIGAEAVEGNVLEAGFTSFVGQYPMATRHGMTMGELAKFFNEGQGIGCDLEIIRVKGWKRPQDADTWGRDWVPPSPNIPNLIGAYTFPGTVHFEGTNVSEGRGTTKPFELIGAVNANPDKLADEMNALRLPGVHFRGIYFQPTYQKGKDQVLGGVCYHVLDRKKFPAFRAGIELLAAFFRHGKESGAFQWKKPPYEYEHDRMPIDLIAGTASLREELEKTGGVRDFLASSKEQCESFKKLRRKFLLY